uniref:Tick transposon n=1 Tax=Rhipicephalus appendiculatus TaxID=34631 RepID=A0A131YDR5_RHIAP
MHMCRIPTNLCNVCRIEVATLTHMLWDCTKNPQGANSGTLPPRWAAALRSPSLGDQLWAVQQAREAAVRQGLDVPTWET